HHLQVIAGVKQQECRTQLQAWFAQRRMQKKLEDQKNITPKAPTSTVEN
ncbi:MAG: hypothetical protein F6K24_38595, partial [Okeania sp. SIO2D1]|nr:hypothetical protein [Okeania sp. SIO2D1]